MIHKYLNLISSAVFLLCFSSCARPGLDYRPANKISASESLAIAESYRVHQWLPTKRNKFHGRDPDGILVNTPDIGMDTSIASRPGWWKPYQTNIGIPYQWGGFDTPISFDEKIKQGLYAGDVYTPGKRSKLYAAVSNHACGVDCSGFVSRCLRLDRAYSTRELPDICTALSSFDLLEAGDIINKRNEHVCLISHFVDTDLRYIMVYETGSPPTWKVIRHVVSVQTLKNLGYKPYRYKNMQ